MSEQRERGYWERHAGRYDRSVRLLTRSWPEVQRLTGEALAGCERALEVAAGTGLLTGTLAGAAREVIATDYAEAMVAQLEARVRAEGLDNVRCETVDVYALPYEPASFDAVVAANVLHLLPDLEGALAALRRVLKPGGRLVAPTFCHDETFGAKVLSRLASLTGFPQHRRFTVAGLRGAIEGAGFEVARVETLPGRFPIGFVAGRVR